MHILVMPNNENMTDEKCVDRISNTSLIKVVFYVNVWVKQRLSKPTEVHLVQDEVLKCLLKYIHEK